jgi:hypothetical protein
MIRQKSLLTFGPDRLLLPTKVAPVSKLDGKGFRNRALAPETHVKKSFRIFAEKKDDPHA